MIIVDEAKSVEDDVFEAIERCHPQRLGVFSSPGACEGMFYDMFHKYRAHYQTMHMSFEDCDHIDRDWVSKQIEKRGEDHPLVRSMIFGEFMEESEDAIFQMTWLEQMRNHPTAWNKDRGEVHAFCDFAAGGDENVFAVRRGNQVWLEDNWRDKNTMGAVGRFLVNFRKAGLKPGQVSGDADGLGKPMCDALADAGFPINEFRGGGKAYDGLYRDRISETWFEGARQVELNKIILPDNEELVSQLVTRKKQYSRTGKLCVESKKDMKNRGIQSPDLADAVLGAMQPIAALGGDSIEDSLDEFLRIGDVEDDTLLVGGINAGY